MGAASQRLALDARRRQAVARPVIRQPPADGWPLTSRDGCPPLFGVWRDEAVRVNASIDHALSCQGAVCIVTADICQEPVPWPSSGVSNQLLDGNHRREPLKPRVRRVSTSPMMWSFCKDVVIGPHEPLIKVV